MAGTWRRGLRAFNHFPLQGLEQLQMLYVGNEGERSANNRGLILVFSGTRQSSRRDSGDTSFHFIYSLEFSFEAPGRRL